MCPIRLSFNQLPGHREEPQKLIWVWKEEVSIEKMATEREKAASLILLISNETLRETKQVCG